MDPENTNRKPLPIIVGIVLIVLVVGAFLFLMQGQGVEKAPSRKPDISGLIDTWQVKDTQVQAEIAPGGKRAVRHTIVLESSTKYIYRKGRNGDSTRPEESGALANISDGIYVNVFLKPNTKIADTIVYADWPL